MSSVAIHSGGMKLSDYERLFSLIKSSKRTVVLTGAGVSTLSGIPDFRSSGGIYSKKFGSLSVESLLDIDFFLQHPEEFYAWARDGWYSSTQYKPSIVHEALCLMEEKGYLSDGIFTQNIDSLHSACGSKKVYELHGTLGTSTCTKCGRKYTFDETRKRLEGRDYPHCDCLSLIRPDIVFYGEALDGTILSRAYSSFESCSLVIVLGTSLVVNPVAQLPYLAQRSGSRIVLVNRDETYLDRYSSLIFRDLAQWGEKTYNFLEKC